MTVIEVSKQLQQQVNQSRDMLLSLGEAIVRHKPSADRWSIIEVVGHLVDSACNNHQRFIRAQESESLTFPKYDQNAWVTNNGYESADWESLVELWHHYNLQLARVIRKIPPEQLETKCFIGDNEACTLEWLAQDYLDHLRHHIRKIEERL